MEGDLSETPGARRLHLWFVHCAAPTELVSIGSRSLRAGLIPKAKCMSAFFDVAVSVDRVIGKDGRTKVAAGNTVDVAGATFTNSIGEAHLMAHWKDPDFDPKQRSFYMQGSSSFQLRAGRHMMLRGWNQDGQRCQDDRT
jgi:hypothetical protein